MASAASPKPPVSRTPRESASPGARAAKKRTAAATTASSGRATRSPAAAAAKASGAARPAKRAPLAGAAKAAPARIRKADGRAAAPARIRKADGRAAAPKRTRVVCLSHREDLDGISAAALVKQAHGGDTVLTDYPGQMKALADIAADQSLKKLFICDLGLSKKNQDEFVDIVSSLRKKRVSVTYVDHHMIDAGTARRLSNLGVRMVHNTNECASVLVYDSFKSKMSDHATFVASCAAITDYMEDRPLGSRLLQMYDRQFALISATVMTYNIVGHQKDGAYLQSLVDALADSKFPHEIPGSFEFAQSQVERLSEMIAKVKAGLKKTRNLAHMEITDAGAGGAVNFVLGLSGKDVGVAYKAKKNEDFYSVSVRGSRSCRVHLGKIVNVLASELGGSGGGHDRACGAIIPLARIKKFVSELNKRIAAA